VIRRARKALRRLLAALPLAVALVVVAAAPGCQSRPAQAPLASTSSPARVAYDAARLALATLDALEEARLDRLLAEGHTAADEAHAELRSKRLQLAHAALTVAHEHLVTGEALDVRRALGDAVRLLEQLADDPAVKVPESARQSIAMAAAWLGGDGGS